MTDQPLDPELKKEDVASKAAERGVGWGILGALAMGTADVSVQSLPKATKFAESLKHIMYGPVASEKALFLFNPKSYNNSLKAGAIAGLVIGGGTAAIGAIHRNRQREAYANWMEHEEARAGAADVSGQGRS